MIDWIVEKIQGVFQAKYIGSVVRTLLALLAGYLIKLGLPQVQIDALLTALDPVLVGVITAGGTAFWSLVQKSKVEPKKK